MKTLIIKLGALGDVVRTTPLLRVLSGEICWVAARAALELLPPRPGLTALALEEAASLKGKNFDAVFSLEENPEAARLAAQVKTKKLIGVSMDAAGTLAYSEDSAPWFDLGLISRLGRARADAAKKANARSYQDMLFGMAGLRFSGQEYWIAPPSPGQAARRGPGLRVGLETRAGPRWPRKGWPQYQELARRLEAAGMEPVFFKQRPSLVEYVQDIAGCDLAVCGDTLAMHLALALGKKTVALFLCTSPAEIYGYGRLKKIASPSLMDHFYASGPEPARDVGVDRVLRAVLDFKPD